MLFSEMPLHKAIYEARQEITNPGSDRWICESSEYLVRLVYAKLPLPMVGRYSPETVIAAYRNFRKRDEAKAGLVVEVANAHGSACFMRYRNRGECSDNVHLDRIVPGSRGGEYNVANCILMCSRHNCQRGDRTLEDYLADRDGPGHNRNSNGD